MTAYRRCVAFWPFDHVEDFQLDVVAADVLEQAGAGAQQDRDQVDADLVDEAGPQQLLTDAGAEDVDILAAGGGCCAGQGFARAWTKVYTPPSGTSGGVLCETMNVGVRAEEPGPSAPDDGMERS